VKVYRVTITGADDNTNPDLMYSISRRYPFVEWGILFAGKSGVPRYPNHHWVNQLLQLPYDHLAQMKLSAHLCGKQVSQWERNHIVVRGGFNRVQLNSRDSKISLNRRRKIRTDPWTQYIFQENPRTHGIIDEIYKHELWNTELLFDCSGGRGEAPHIWPNPVAGVRCGYAGGLGPKTLPKLFAHLKQFYGMCWIDMETHVRSDVNGVSELDFAKVVEVLEMVSDEYYRN